METAKILQFPTDRKNETESHLEPSCYVPGALLAQSFGAWLMLCGNAMLAWSAGLSNTEYARGVSIASNRRAQRL
jgi:hypothetical protein